MIRLIRYSVLLLLGLAGPALLAQVETQAEFQPKQAEAGELIQYILVVDGEQGTIQGSVPMPLPEGLKIVKQDLKQRFSISNINGMQRRVHILYYIFYMVADRPGTFEIPPYEVQLQKSKVTVPAASLQIFGSGQQQENRPGLIEILVQLPREEIYTGETVEARVRINIPEGTQFKEPRNAWPKVTGENFTIGPYIDSKAFMNAQDQDENGQTVTSLNYPLTLTPLKAGDMDLQAAYTLYVGYPSRLGGRRLEYLPLEIASSNLQGKVLPLPSEGKPEDFSGAIGQFELKQTMLSTDETIIGEPITLTLSLSGTGNFDRAQAPMIEAGSDWKIYEPEVSFLPTDEFELSGTKTFEYILIPQVAGEVRIPPVQYNAFDPIEKRYVALKAPPIPITVLPDPDGGSPVRSPNSGPVVGATQPTNQDSAAEAKRPDQLIDQKASLGASASLRPVFTKAWFWALNLVLGGVLAGSWHLLHERERLRKHPELVRRKEQEKELNTQQQLAEKTREEPEAFYNAAIRAIQAAVGRFADQEPATITFSDVESALRMKHAHYDIVQLTKTFYERADALRYGGKLKHLHDPEAAQAELDRILEVLS